MSCALEAIPSWPSLQSFLHVWYKMLHAAVPAVGRDRRILLP